MPSPAARHVAAVRSPGPWAVALVVVAGDPDDRRLQPLRDGFDGSAKVTVGIELTEVGQVPREDDGIRSDSQPLDSVERPAEVRGGVEPPAQRPVVGQKVGVAHVEECAPRGRVLAELHGLHAGSLGPRCE